MIKPFISIVMPCYNCSSTLKEAFDSIYRQHFSYPFEVILVDDGSKDDTVALIQRLAAGRPECRFIQHEKNRGGGAARNTAIKASSGEFIFCLDSDDVLADGSLPLMVAFAQKERLDGTIFQYRRFFSADPSKHREESNPTIERDISLSDLFEPAPKRVLFNNFVYTRKAFDVVGGYPEDHGFDTPEFEFTFLGKGLRSRICPGSIYYHRQAAKHKSYFEREYEKGLFSIYVYLALERTIGSFTDSIVDLCAQFDAGSNNELRNENNLLGAIRRQYEKDGSLLLSQEKGKRSARSQAFIDAAGCIRSGRYQEASDKIALCRKEYGSESPILLFNSLRARYGTNGMEQAEIIGAALRELEKYGILKHRRMRRVPPFISKIYLACKRVLGRD